MRNQYTKYNLRASKESRRRGREEGRVLRTVYFLKGNADMGGYTYRIYIYESGQKSMKKPGRTRSNCSETTRRLKRLGHPLSIVNPQRCTDSTACLSTSVTSRDNASEN